MSRKTGAREYNFLTFATPEEMKSTRARYLVSSHVSRLWRRKTQPLRIQPRMALQNSTSWIDAAQQMQIIRSGSSRAGYSEEAANDFGFSNPRKIPGQVSNSILLFQCRSGKPTNDSLTDKIPLVLQVYPLFACPVEVMLDGAAPYATGFLANIDVKDIYPAIISMSLTWFWTQFPTQYLLDSARYYRSQAISSLRRKMTLERVREDVVLMVICLLQTDALMSDTKALMIHRKGLEAVLQGKGTQHQSDQYLNIVKNKHDLLLDLMGDSIWSDLWESTPAMPIGLQYPAVPNPPDVSEIINKLPEGFRAIALQQRGLSIELVKSVAWTALWMTSLMKNQSLRFHARANTSRRTLDTEISEIRRILRYLDPSNAPLERCFCLAYYTSMASMYYKPLCQGSPVFQDCRKEATNLLLSYIPETVPEREFLLYTTMLVMEAWKKVGLLEPEGVKLIQRMKLRYPEMRQWGLLKVILKRFIATNHALIEWERDLQLN